MIPKLFKSKIKVTHLQVEELSETELHEIVQIHKSGFSKAWDEREIVSTLNNKGVNCLLAKQKNHIIGFVIYRIVADEAEIITIATSAKYRKQGAAKQMLYEMQRHCLTERVLKIFLEVDNANVGAVALYKKAGYSQIGERKGYYKNIDANTLQDGETSNSSDALIMQLDLSA